jgi:hypothetical protein
MHGRSYKLGLIALAVLMLAASGFIQRGLNNQRATDPRLGFTRVAPLENAPPVLAFTTVALGGFRGLIVNALWIRANDLQNDGKYFEMVQLADWITKLEPTFAQVWIVQAWNMAYNISVKFPEAADRWRWVQRGIELLRDDGLRYNPREALIYRELGWFFQHKMGQNLDDAHNYYKQSWAISMTNLFGGPKPSFDELLNPTTPEAKRRADELRTRYKMDPGIMREVDQAYGPLEWRLPEAHAIYWAYVGLKKSRRQDLITLRRVIYQSMQMTVLRGKLISIDPLAFGPDLDKADRGNAAYEQMMAEETELKYAIQIAHKSFLRELVYLCYVHGRNADANRWFGLLKQKYPDMVQPGITMEQFSLERIQSNMIEGGQVRTEAILDGILRQHFTALALDQDDYADGLDRMAQYLWNFYTQRAVLRQNAVGLRPLPEMKARVLDELLQSKVLPSRLQDRLRTRTGLPASTGAREEKPAPAPTP